MERMPNAAENIKLSNNQLLDIGQKQHGRKLQNISYISSNKTIKLCQHSNKYNIKVYML